MGRSSPPLLHTGIETKRIVLCIDFVVHFSAYIFAARRDGGDDYERFCLVILRKKASVAYLGTVSDFV
jgi:hypothetical protein